MLSYKRRPMKKFGKYLGVIPIIGVGTLAMAGVLDQFGPPPDDDPSALTGPVIGEDAATDALENLPKTYIGAFEGGATGTSEDQGVNNAVPESQLENSGGFEIPTGGPPSPLFGAQEFEQQLLRHEELGRESLQSAPQAQVPFPTPQNAQSGPSPAAIENFLAQPGVAPFPTEFANEGDQNPWQSDIEDFLGRNLDSPPAEGRPPGRGWAHQRWNEFYPQVFTTTAQAEARINGGFRDTQQRHGYQLGEFAPGGLYHTVYSAEVGNAPTTTGTTAGIPVQFHPNFPVQNPDTVWTFDGTFPPKLKIGRYGEAVLLRHYNALPIDPSANRGFGLHTLSTHEHNGHNPAESDGYTNAFFFPGQFYDYRWPMQLAGYDTINTTASDARAAMPCEPGEQLFVNDTSMGSQTCDANGRIQLRGDWRETMSTHWFHDHMLDFTAPNVYKGNAAMFNYYSALDRGNEAHDDGVNLRLPSGSALSWGNRDYDVNLNLADKAWDQTGQLWFNIFNLDGFMGDHLLTNWLYKPFLDVRARRYRFRILNGSVSRYMTLAMVRQIQGAGGEFQGPNGSGVSYDRVPFHMVANDGNIMTHTIPFDGSIDLDRDGQLDDHNAILPTLANAERYDIIVDFSRHGITPGDKIYFVNLLEHKNGKRPNELIPLRSVLRESYKAINDGDRYRDGDPAVGRFLELRVHAYDGVDQSMDPTQFEPGGQQLIPLPTDRNDPQLASALKREFIFGRSGGSDDQPWTVNTDGGNGLAMDARRISAAPRLTTGPTVGGFDGTLGSDFDMTGRLEVWKIENGGGGWSHPIHVHFEEGVILKRGGEDPPAWETWARKDVYRVGHLDDSTDSVEVALRFREFAGTFMEHCHNTQHEDRAMLLRWDIERPGQVKLMPTPIPTWDGVEYVDSAALPTFRTGLNSGDNTGGLFPVGGANGGTTDGGSTDGGATNGGITLSNPAPANRACFFDNADWSWTGTSETDFRLCRRARGVTNWGVAAGRSDSISAISVGSGVHAIIYDGRNGTGESLCISEDTDNNALGSLSDRASSYEIGTGQCPATGVVSTLSNPAPANRACFFDNADWSWTGTSETDFRLCRRARGVTNWGVAAGRSDSISAISVGSGVHTIIYAGRNGTGESLCIGPDTDNNSLGVLSDQASSFSVGTGSCP